MTESCDISEVCCAFPTWDEEYKHHKETKQEKHVIVKINFK